MNEKENAMSTLIIYIHGKGGSISEAEHYAVLFPEYTVLGFDYKSETPREAVKEFQDYFDTVSIGYDKIYLLANSIGAFFSLCALSDRKIEKAFFVSPIVNMEKLIYDMMAWAGVSEQELEAQNEIPTTFGETLSWEYLLWVRNHPIIWDIPTEILYGSSDNMQSIETIGLFVKEHNANLTIMEKGEHWFHTKAQMALLEEWLRKTIFE